MKKYKVIIEEILTQEFLIEAESEEAATKKAITGYKNNELCLDNAECTYVQMSVENSEWFEI